MCQRFRSSLDIIGCSWHDLDTTVFTAISMLIQLAKGGIEQNSSRQVQQRIAGRDGAYAYRDNCNLVCSKHILNTLCKAHQSKEHVLHMYSLVTTAVVVTTVRAVHLLRNVACDTRIPKTCFPPHPVSTAKPLGHERKHLSWHPVSCSCIAGVFRVQPHWHIWSVCPKLMQKVCRVGSAFCGVPLTSQLFGPAPMQTNEGIAMQCPYLDKPQLMRFTHTA